MRVLHISVLDKKATYLSRNGDIVCGNSDYVIEFAFDAEWDAHEEKIARFIWNGHYNDVTFTGTTCPVPIITNTTAVEIGVYAGELSTTTPAIISCQKSILCQSTAPGGIPFTKGEKGDKGDPGDSGVFVVNTYGSKLMQLTSDKTLAELLSAHQSGKLLRCVHFFDGVYTVLSDYKVSDNNSIHFRNNYDYIVFLLSSDGSTSCHYVKDYYSRLPLIKDDDNGKVLGAEDGQPAWVDPPAAGVADYVVNMLYNVNSDERYTADKTATEIVAAIKSGQNVQIVRKDGTSYETWNDIYLTDFLEANNFIHIFAANAQNRVDIVKDGSDEYVTVYPVENIGGSENVFLVTLTGTDPTTSDCTLEELISAHKAGKLLICVSNGIQVTTQYSTNSTDRFSFYFDGEYVSFSKYGITRFRKGMMLPHPSEKDAGKVPTVNENGSVEWELPTNNTKVINLNDYPIPENGTEAKNLGELFATAPLEFLHLGGTAFRVTAFADAVKALLTEFNTDSPIHIVYSMEFEGMRLAYEITSVFTMRENGAIHQVSFGDTVFVGELFGEPLNVMADIRVALNEDGSIVFSVSALEPVHFPILMACPDCEGTGWDGDCTTCDGTGKERCDTCFGSGEVDCHECYNTGTRTCDSCAGTGQWTEYRSCDSCGGSGGQDVSCDSCGGSGNQEVSCDYCGGSGNTADGEQCPECGGTGNREESCGSCGGSGTRTEFCGDCGGQGTWEEHVNCDACGGNGGIQCEHCEGTGKVPCGDCNDGYRDNPCPHCEGSGSNWCNTCGGTGSIEI